MKKEYSKKEIERILKSEVEIPKAVDQGISRAYREIGIDTKVTMKYTKKHRALAAVAIVAAMVTGLSIVTFAANKFLNAYLVDEGDNKVGYQFEIDRTKEAHAVKVEPTYIPDGYVPANVNDPEGGKWKNENTGGDISVYSYNAAELDDLERKGELPFQNLEKDKNLKSLEISGMKTDVFVSDDFYTDSDKTIKDIYLFNEENGYMVCVWSKSDLSADEMIKVAKGVKVTVLDTVVPYTSDEDVAEEQKADKMFQEAEDKKVEAGVSKDQIFKIGQEVKNPVETSRAYEDVRYTVEDIQVKDALSLDEYPAENYVNYADEMAPWVNPDGTLKPHDRYRKRTSTDADAVLEKDVASKYIVVKMKAVNHGKTGAGTEDDYGVSMAPDLSTLEPREDGNYSYPSSYFLKGNESYELQWESGNFSSFPVYFDKIYHTKGIDRIKAALIRPLQAGEELEYTLIYVIDEDQLDHAYLEFYQGVASAEEIVATPYVKITK
ncbi:MAG: DUF4367 domain-containing protein [Faecalicatena sp.]|uniref:DUF4367 domain-containing protein n=1 Tax=Faecalicatena sp. TaxID=2005360 RepID=UPI002583EB7F|nr:DUF4367 domain-containing protein [Faecalicatena sp.]MCI6466032.1 DUF4367 domain-containing protein [Faecalicatena sp.]MDY5620038.1 DUF4367 domain-containing protein [Lachnospiraceae bacterium]